MKTFTMSPKQSYFLSQPHQPFFIFGVLWALVSMMIFILSHKGVVSLSISENEFHLYSLSFLVFAQFFHGFLFTTFPRFCSAPAIPRETYIRIVWLYQIGATLFIVGSLFSEWLALAAMFTVLFAQSMAVFSLYWIYKIGQSPLKSDPYWILIAHGITLVVHAVLVLGYALNLMWAPRDWLPFVSPFIINFFFVFLTFSVAQRMIPFFSHSQESKSRYFVEIVFGALVIKTLLAVLAFTVGEAIISVLLAIYLIREFLRWKLHPFHAPAIVWVLHLALFWLPAALLIGACTQIAEIVHGVNFLYAGTHLLALGFLTTVLIGFGTRVTLGHSGQSPHADKIAIAIFWWTQILILIRFALSVDTAFGGNQLWLFDAAATGWLLLFLVWGARYGKVLLYGKKIS